MQQVHKFKDEDNKKKDEDIYLICCFLYSCKCFCSVFIHHPEARQRQIKKYLILLHQLLFPLIFS